MQWKVLRGCSNTRSVGPRPAARWLACLWLVPALLLVCTGSAYGRLSRQTQRAIKQAKQLTLNELVRNPAGYLGQVVTFDCFFAETGDVYRPFHTPFVRQHFINFSVWQLDAQLWEPKEREKAFFLCFVDRKNGETVQAVQNLKVFDPLRVVARVETVSDEKPWLTVLHAERVDMPTYSEKGLKYIDLGMQRLQVPDFEMASKLFEVALAEYLPLEARKLVYRHIGLAYYELGQYASAETALHNAEKLITTLDPLLYLRLGQSKLHIGEATCDEARLKDAVAFLDRAVKEEPKLAEGYADLGLAHGLLENYRDAVYYTDFAIKLVPRHARALRNQAAIYRLRGDLKQAELQLQKAIEAKPDEPLYHRELGDVFMELGKFSDAEIEYRNFITLAPQNEEAYYLRARSRMAQDNVNGAIEDLTAAIEHGPRYEPSYPLLSEAFQRQQKWADAVMVLERAADTFPEDAKIRLLLGNLLRKLGRWDECVETLAEAAALVPADHDLHYQWAQALADKPLPDRTKALGILEELLGKRPDMLAARFLAGRLYVETHKPRNALLHLTEYLKVNPQDIQALLYRGAAYTQGGEFARAVASYREVLRVDASNPYAAANAAYVMCLRGQELEQAQAYSSLAYQADNKNPQFGGVYSWALSLAGRYDEARALADQLLAQGETAEVYYYLALAEFGLEDIDLSREHVKRALELGKALPKTRDSALFVKSMRQLESKVKAALDTRERELRRRRRESIREAAPAAPAAPPPTIGPTEFLAPM